ncbi:septum formation family protein [Arthrobacter sp. 35W]|uniref:septum formation family protein n=1 Tax=Arthrobacter sp. 35W TaxID=1132441 RepID=UPI000423EEB7|nr:septum formation family protein [Arthrobacter sp. 35W]
MSDEDKTTAPGGEPAQPGAQDDAALAADAALDLPEPELGSAEISPEVAASLSLDQVEEEAATLAREAESTGTLVAGSPFAHDGAPATEPTTQVPPSQPWAPPTPQTPAQAPAPASGMDSGVPPVPPLPGGPLPGGPFPGAPGTNGAPVAGGPTPSYPGGPGQPPAGWAGGPGMPAGPGGPGMPGAPGGKPKNTKLPFIIGAAVLVALVLAGLVIWLAISAIGGLVRNSTPASDGTSSHAATSRSTSSTTDGSTGGGASDDGLVLADVTPLDWIQGDCLRGFKDAATSADVVLCETPHSAQLVATSFYSDSDSYPGVDALKAKATATCDSVELVSAADNYNLKTATAYPSENSWGQGDRRVDCLVFDPTGDNITETLVKQ